MAGQVGSASAGISARACGSCWLRAARCPPAHLGWAPSPPPTLLSQGYSLHRVHPCPKFHGSQERPARSLTSATATAFTPKVPKMLILKDSRSSRKLIPHGSDLPLQERSCASVSPLGTQRDMVLLLQLHRNGTAGRDPWAWEAAWGGEHRSPSSPLNS